jgi:outer membrane protein OmpA-like peptidoglycan-associated protein
MEDNNFNFRLRCKSCNNDIKSSLSNCPQCGLVNGCFETNDPLGKFGVVCEKCNQALPLQNIPLRCNHCNSDNIEWWNADHHWYQVDLSTNLKFEQQGIWLSGDFEGEFEGEPNVTSSLKSKGASEFHRQYNIKLVGGTLKNPVRVSSPPIMQEPDERRPFRSDVVHKVRIEENDSTEAALVSLQDFRLHKWMSLASKEVHQNGKKLVGRVTGVGYGYLLPPEEELPTQIKAEQKELNQELPTGLDEDCLACGLHFRLAISAMLWIFCNSHVAGIFLGVSTIACMLGSYLHRNGHKVISGKKRIFLVLLVIILTGLGLWLLKNNGCTYPGYWGPILVGLALLLTAWLLGCLIKLLASLVFALSLLMWCSNHEHGCGTAGAWQSPIQARLTQLGNLLSMKPQNAVASAPTENQDQLRPSHRRVSIDQALRDPNLLKDCRNSIYFPEAGFFAENEAVLQESAYPNLKKVSQLLEQYPDAHLVIIGHSNQRGDDTEDGLVHNIDLSQARAEAVANWLRLYGNKTSHIEVIGMGSKYPLVDHPNSEAEYAVNRRVELSVSCNGKQ